MRGEAGEAMGYEGWPWCVRAAAKHCGPLRGADERCL